MSILSWLTFIMVCIVLLHYLVPIFFGVVSILSLSISQRIRSKTLQHWLEEKSSTFHGLAKIYDRKISHRVERLYLVFNTIYFAINPIFLVVSTKEDTIAKYLSFIVSVSIILLAEFWFLFKKSARRNLQFVWKLASPIVLSLYLIYLIISYIPELRSIDFLKPYLTEENRNILAGGFVVFIALRRIIDDVKKRFNIHEDYFPEKKAKRQLNDMSSQAVNTSGN